MFKFGEGKLYGISPDGPVELGELLLVGENCDNPIMSFKPTGEKKAPYSYRKIEDHDKNILFEEFVDGEGIPEIRMRKIDPSKEVMA